MMRGGALATVVLLSAPAAAQTLTGTVRDAASGQPIGGVVVEVLGATGAMQARGLTDVQGRYRVLLPGSAARARASRIGFRPRVVPIASGQAVLDLNLVALPNLLEPIVVSDQPSCPRRPDRAAALALWEQARAGLLATVVARESDTATLKRLSFVRILGRDRPDHLAQLVRVDTASAGQPWTALLSPADFVKDGFVLRRRGSRRFHAPDAEVLLHEAFTSGYCFHLAPAADTRPGAVGLGIEPAPRLRAGRVDISGTLWIDTARTELQELVFRYVGLPPAEDVGEPGGSVAFRALPNGSVVVERWAMRFLSTPEVRDAGEARRRPVTAVGEDRPRERTFILFVRETGGQLAEARFRDGSRWRARLGHVRGRLLHEGAPVPNAPVRLVGTDYASRTDDDGEFELHDVLPGNYVFGVGDARLERAGLERTRAQLVTVVAGESRFADVLWPTDADIIRARCAESTGPVPGGVMIAGRVRTASGERSPAALVQLFQARGVTMHDTTNPAAAAAGKVQWDRIIASATDVGVVFESVYDGEVGSAGLFTMCDLPPNALFRVEVRQGGERATTFVSTASATGRRIHPLDIVLERR
jgi:hypothetical protein